MDDDSTLAGWHRDPSGRHELRFWNGDRWSEHVIDDGIPGLDAPTRSGRAPAAVASTPPPPLPDAHAGSPVDTDTDTDAAVVDLHLAEAAEREPAMSTPSRRTEARSGSRQNRPRPSPASPTLGVRGRITPPVEPQPIVATAAVEDERDVESVAMPTAVEPEPAPVEVEGLESEAVEPEAIEPVVEADANVERDPEPKAAAVEPDPDPEPELEMDVSASLRRDSSVRSVIAGPTVASPAGNSAGSNTSAIADPHAGPGNAPQYERTGGARVAGVAPVPVKRYRPGSPPPSPFARPTALPAPIGPIGTVVAPWYRKPLAWVAIAVLTALVGATAVYFATRSTGDSGPARLGGRAPAGAPRGSKVIDGDGFGIAAPIGWITTTDPGKSFPQLVKTNWATPLAALDPGTRQGLIVIPLRRLAHLPQVDPDLFWTDQVELGGTGRPIQHDAPLGVHGYRANRVTITDLSGAVMVAAAIDTGDHTYLVAFTGPDSTTANARFERLIQTFDAR